MQNRLEKMIAVITGSARGIGYGIAERFAEEGSTVIILDLNQEQVDEAVSRLTAHGYSAEGYAANVTDSERIGEIFKELDAKYGKIDILVNNAGITKDNLIMRMKESDWDAVINVNLKGTFICTQKISRYLLKQKSGCLVNIASVIGIMGNAGQANYAASKGGVISLTKSSAKEFASRGIRVNAVAPGFIETEMTQNLPEEVVKSYSAAIPLQKMGSIRNVADLCLFLASKEAEYITGQVINVDGGLII
ncbi:MAG: 3-oxoacyl-[acyl-carrier-protein] reductase [Candidatus Cloacimonetes bacterium]|nr:3-oxoacyl-[acyl-carrier-protein] reductase [Candidatus Cloacimonadota bacterium]